MFALFIVGTAHIILSSARPVDGSQFAAAVLTVETAGKEVQMFSLPTVTAVMAAFFDFP